MINRVVLVGRITADPEIRKTQTGLSVTRFTLALDNGKDKPADFINCVAWRQSADFLGEYARKGFVIGVDGRISTRSYEKDGHKVYVTEVVADTVRICSGKQNSNGQGNGQPQQNRSQKAQNEPKTDDFGLPQGLDFNPDDLPF